MRPAAVTSCSPDARSAGRPNVPKLLKGGADEPLTELFECQALEARDREGDRSRRHAGGSAVLWNPPAPPGGPGPGLAAELQRGDRVGELVAGRDRRVL